MLFGQRGLWLGLMLLGVAGTAQASKWVKAGSLYLAVPELEGAVSPAFHYGTDAIIDLPGFDSTESIYYQVQSWQGDAQTGSYAAPSGWACQDLTTLNGNNQQLKFPLTTGRYRVNVVAVMQKETCDVTAYEADDLIASEVYTSNEFMVINHDKLDYLVNGVAQSTFAQNPNPETLTGMTGRSNYYNLHMTWPTIAGSENYQVVVVKDGTEYALDAVTPATYASDISTKGYHTVVDTYDAATETFSPHTGFGTFQYKLRYQLGGQWSDAISHSASINIIPEKPRFFTINDKASKSTLPQDVVEFKWQVRILMNADHPFSSKPITYSH